MARTKVFVGNLSFKTRETGLTQEFETAGKVISATIVTRKGRSLGYGFVEFENEAAAAKAVQNLNKKEIDGRPVNVEIAKPRDENAPKPQHQGGYQGGYGGQFRRGGFRRGGGGFRGRYPRGNYGFGGGYGYRNSRGNFKPRGGFRSPRPTPEQRNLQPSSTTLYITNLPFSLTNEQFTKFFTDAGIKPKSVKIIIARNGRSRGYGFVEFESSADQQKALSLDKKSIEGREIVMKVALVSPQPTPQATPQPTQTASPATQQTQTKTTTQQPPQPGQSAQQGQGTPAKPTQNKPEKGSPTVEKK